MAKSALKTTSTQKFIEIIDISDNIVVLNGGNAAIVIEVKATNFALLSADEQDAKIFSYASLLNSLSFSIQIVIRSKKLNISNYLNLLELEKTKTQNQALSNHIGLYKNFVQELVKVNTVLDKKFYIVIPYSSLERGLTGAKQSLSKNSLEDQFLIGAKASLKSKAESVLTQLGRLNLKSEVLDKEKLTKLFYDIFNDETIEHHQTEHAKSPIVLGKEKA